MVSVRLAVVVASIAALPLFGCSFSYSSESSGKTLASPFTSSESSSSGGDRQSYREDLRDYTASYVKSGADLAGFERGVADVARRHGILNWEADDATWIGIGAGLAKARVKEGEFPTYQRVLGRNDPAKMAYIGRGYDSNK